MSEKINELVFEILKKTNYKKEDTSIFRNLMHNDDLVPKFKENFETLSRIIGKYYNDCYDIQGIRDDGVDVLLKYSFNDEFHEIGFQIKSFGDIQEKDWLTKLKAQILEAQAIWKTEDYYIVLCTDAIYHKDKLRNAISDIEKLSNNKIHIIEPTQALSFYNFNDIDMFSIIYNFFHQNDSGLEKAKSCIASLSLKERKFLIDIIVNQFSSNDKGISLQEYDIPNDMDLCSFNNSRYYNLDEDNFTISYSYTENWDLTLFIVEIITKFRLHGNELKDFLLNQLCE